MQDEFKEIQLKEVSEPNDSSVEAPRLLSIPLPAYKIGNLGFAPQQAPAMAGGLLHSEGKGQDLMLVALNERDERFGVVLRQAKTVKVLSILDILAVFLYLIALLYPLLILLPVSLLGFFAGKRFSRPLSISQAAYLLVALILRIVLCALIKVTAFQVVQGILTVFTVCEAICVIRLYRTIGTLSAAEVDELKVQQQGIMKFNSQPLHTL
mmetsp:Transcript_18329/g.32943  ORF Transcript_18329/g.32943 Transcript_18329/m.32943 type:complete len:210 (-) Transcript_18329:1284-1913(-)